MNKLFTAIALVMCFIGQADSLDREGSFSSMNQRPKPDFQKLIKLMNLDGSKEAEFKLLTEKHRIVMKNNRLEHEKTKQQVQKQRRDIHKSHKQELSRLLNESQMEIFDLYMRQFRKDKRTNVNKTLKYKH